MNATRSTLLFLVAAASLLAFGGGTPAEARTPNTPALQKFALPKAKTPKFDLTKLAPKVQFKAKGKLNKTTAKVQVYALVTLAGKTKRISILDMGMKKSGKSVQVKRTFGKLKVSLKVSWSGTRSITVKGTARYLKFKVPVPTLRIKV